MSQGEIRAVSGTVPLRCNIEGHEVTAPPDDGSLGARRERAYGEWLEGPDYFSDCDEYGSQRAAFYAGIGWAAREIRRLESRHADDRE